MIIFTNFLSIDLTTNQRFLVKKSNSNSVGQLPLLTFILWMLKYALKGRVHSHTTDCSVPKKRGWIQKSCGGLGPSCAACSLSLSRGTCEARYAIYPSLVTSACASLAHRSICPEELCEVWMYLGSWDVIKQNRNKIQLCCVSFRTWKRCDVICGCDVSIRR